MGIFPGGAAIKEVYAGAPIKEVYAGSQLVWSSAPPLSPATLGAIHWLPFTNSPTEDIGNSPVVWGTNGTMEISNGALIKGELRNPSNSTWTPAGPHSFTGWVSTTDTGNYLNTVFNVSASYSRMAFYFHGSTRAARWEFQRGGTSYQTVNAGSVPTGWVFIAMCMEPTTGTTWRYRAYINGAEVANATYGAGTQHPITSVSPRFISSSAALDDCALYNRALTAQEIASLHQLGRTT